ncbi:uncharacterized protein BT62DRAFT_1077386 [Guyanagaster necrorhizus]|uniref:DRBM domain-containing protein n=1 Tax=Guyanagaster necrorhizus TaxID=856835 RepID=A0A9P8AR78_9AGAR|nr:uncharacterized protein BT62DRAFT_1077386 [Guyanagaster necrorhizus MCA 3950]KAG7444591.1 hypothetical protein BT62DRAFT_1077386 [Guyanagaster necrorhizus MCA 3950]
MNPQRHYRQDLNSYANQGGLTLTYDKTFTGPQHSGTWTVVAYIGDIEHGRGTASNQGQAKEIASYHAMVALGLNVD